jgi:chromosome segregation ATPase
LTEQLITERFEAARLSIELADAKAEAAQINEAFHEQSELLAALMAVLRTRDRQDAALRAQTADVRQEMEAAQAELQHTREENHRLAAELATAREAASSVKMMAVGNLAVTRHPEKRVLHAAGASAALEQAKQPVEMLPAIWVHRLPATPLRQTRLEGTK